MIIELRCWRTRLTTGFLTSALLACGSESPTPSGVQSTSTADPQDGAWFIDEARQRGLHFTHSTGHGELFLFPELMGSGAALFDMDHDGDLDAFCVQSGSLASQAPTAHRLFKNDGTGHFTDVSSDSGQSETHGYGMGVAAGDLDGDGNLDLYVTQVGPNLLLLGDGQGHFVNASQGSGADDPGWGTSACFFDFDRDGDLDIFVTNYLDWEHASERDCFGPAGLPDYCGPSAYAAPSVDALLRNDGQGRFTNITAEAGISTARGNGLGVTPGDFDGNGWLDLFVANDQNADRLWLNQGDGTFLDRGELSGVARSPYGGVRAGMGVDACDVDGDDDLDLLVVHIAREHDGFYRNQGRFFVEETAKVGISSTNLAFTRFGVGFHDFNLDGRLDLFIANGRVNLTMKALVAHDAYAEPNSLLRGNPNGRWSTVPLLNGSVEETICTSRGAAFGDVDGDGAIDILVINREAKAQLLLNRSPQRGHWLRVRLLDQGHEALGANARVTLNGQAQRRDCKPHYSYCSSSDSRLTFGLGDASEVPEVQVRWTDGSTETFGPFEADRDVDLERGTGH